MVKSVYQNTSKKLDNQGREASARRSAKIGPDTKFEVCDSRMTAFGGMLNLVKFLDFVKFRDVFEEHYRSPSRTPKLGCYRMMLGFLTLLFIGFSRLGHFAYIRRDQMVSGILDVTFLPAISTFWRYLRSLGLNQSKALLNIGAVIRSRVWQACELEYTWVCIDIDTTVSTVYGNIEGSRKGHNTKHRGKKGLRPVLLFLEQTREYICGTQRRGTTMSDEDVAKLIGSIGRYLPTSVKQVLIRGDAEFIGAKTVEACRRHGYNFIFANKRCTPDFEETNWYTKKDYAYNEVQHHPLGWQQPCRFVAMRMDRTREKDNGGAEQLSLFGSDRYKYRVFATNLKWLPHVVIKKYDKRADVENLVGEAQREGILAIPSKRFLSNHAFFQIVMLAYNIWRWMKIMAACERRGNHDAQECLLDGAQEVNVELMDQTIRIARLKMLFLPAKITTSGRKVKVSYSSHDARSEGVCDFLSYLDRRRKVPVQWIDNVPLGSWRSAA